MSTRNPAEKSRVCTQGLKADDSQPVCHHLLIRWTFLWSLLSMVKGSSMLVAPASPPSLEAGTHSSTQPEPLSELESLRRCQRQPRRHTLSLLLNVYRVLGKLTTATPGATFIRGSMILLGDRTSPQLHSEEEGTLELSPGSQVLAGGIAAACHWWT